MTEEDKWKVLVLRQIALITKGQLDIEFVKGNLNGILEAV